MIDMRLLVVDLLAERKAFGKEGVREIVAHFDDPEVFLWSLTPAKEQNMVLAQWSQNLLIATTLQ